MVQVHREGHQSPHIGLGAHSPQRSSCAEDLRAPFVQLVVKQIDQAHKNHITSLLLGVEKSNSPKHIPPSKE